MYIGRSVTKSESWLQVSGSCCAAGLLFRCNPFARPRILVCGRQQCGWAGAFTEDEDGICQRVWQLLRSANLRRVCLPWTG